MKRTLFVDKFYGYNRIALLEDGEIAEYYMEKESDKSIVGNIYIGRVTNVIEGMQSAFIDIGCKENAYIHIQDVYSLDGRKIKSIKAALHVGQEVAVQVIKESQEMKGIKVSQNIMLSGQYAVLTPYKKLLSISSKIESKSRRTELNNLLHSLEDFNYGVIVRTSGETASDDEIKNEILSLTSHMEELLKKAQYVKAPALLYSEGLFNKIIKGTNLMGDDEIILQKCEELDEIQANITSAFPELKSRIKIYDGERSYLKLTGVDTKIKKLFSRKVWLKSGGYIIIDKTEAMTVIDVNSGKNTGKRNLESTILLTNSEAAVEIARQIRLRDIGGMILIDFIDMSLEEDKNKIIKLLEKEIKKDKSRATVLDITKLGIIELTRRKLGGAFYDFYYRSCTKCKGRGEVPDYQGLTLDLFYDIEDYFSVMKKSSLKIEINQEFLLYLKNNAALQLNIMEEKYQLSFSMTSNFNDPIYKIVP